MVRSRRCKAQFCYICGGVWDANVGCPNFCNGEEEMERRRAAEELRLAEERAEKAAAEAAALAEAIEREAAEQRTASNAELKALREQQKAEMARFLSFEKRMRWVLWNRHAQEKTLVAERYRELADKMRERHAKTVAHLEDRQIAAEMDLRATLEAMERSVRIRLKHMEAYCEGLGRTATNGGANDGTAPANSMPPRVVTERDLRELGQQYNVRDGMERLHAAKINVMRDRQQKQMEELLERQEAELARLDARRADELDAVDAAFNEDDDAATATFLARRERLSRRWEIQAEILRTKIELRDNLKLAPLPELRWPQEAIDVAAPLANDTARVVVGTSIVEDELDSQIAALDLHEKTALADRIPAITYSTVLVG